MTARHLYASKRARRLSGYCNPSWSLATPEGRASHDRCTLLDCSCEHHKETSVTITEAEDDVIEAHILWTPAAYLVTDAEPESDEWFAARRGGITGTDLPKILGDTKYGNALSVWLDKRGELEDDAGEAARWGQLLEDVVAQEWAARNGTTVERVGVLANDDEPWMRASLDRLVDRCPDGDGLCGLEVKTRSAFKAGSFRDDIPDDVLSQVLWGLTVTGLDHMHVAVLLGGQTLKSFRVERDKAVEAYLIEAAYPVWQAVQDGVPPEAHPDAEGVLLALLNKMYGARAGDRELEPEQAIEWLDAYSVACDLERDAKAAKTRAKTALVQMLDDGDTGLLSGAPAFTYKAPAPSEALPSAELRRLREESPEIYEALRSDGYIQPTKPAPRFNIAGARKDSK